MARDEVRVVLVKPGDVLLIGNVGSITNPDTMMQVLRGFREECGVQVALFAADIDIDVWERGPRPPVAPPLPAATS